MKCGGEKDDRRTATISQRRPQCPITPTVLDLAEPRDAPFVMVSLVSSGTTHGEPPFVPRSASIASKRAAQMTSVGCPGFTSPYTRRQRTARGLYDVRDARRAASHDHDHGLVIRDNLTVLGADVERAGSRLSRDWLGWPSLSDQRERGISGMGGRMSFISQRSNQYLETARTPHYPNHDRPSYCGSA